MKKIDRSAVYACVHPYSYDDDDVPVVYNPRKSAEG